ncbi:alanine/glycine:cation symporter family protein [Catellatospora coxensis]|uniref:Sodium:alanine symporter n=1 Tax=Catellatospora coxensis TaxID=310354 RepID=A0A8J3KYY2_9ACTN|nr:alanine/glycine:cation symporter family protein [Catellatospora coxensis]GIG05616.1 sodium:alanine symporter [Catellatospora coxensis]
MDFIQQSLIDPLSRFLWNYVLIYVLIGAGLYFTVRTRFVQFRMFGQMITAVRGSRDERSGVSPFQAFCVGLASRVGTGNIAGVAIALTLGGPGAIFWMWVVGLVGMATAFVESSLAQLYKVRGPDGAFRGGPATYIQRGLGSRGWGAVFAVLLIFTFGIAFNMVQANTIVDVVASLRSGGGPELVALVLVVLTAPVIFGGIRRIARVAEYVVPVMAAVYILLALAVVLLNLGEVPGMLATIVRSASGLDPAAAGLAGGLSAALLNGAKRGLFSNEAGMGSAPNAAATATTSHPARQGLIQSLGVFVDTIVICTATAFMIMLGGDDVYRPGQPSADTGASLTQAAVSAQFGGWSTWLMAGLVTVFAFSSILGNTSYALVNLDFLRAGRGLEIAFRVVVLAAVALGSVLALQAVWDFADVAMALMALVNLTAIVLLGRWAFGLLHDFEDSLRAGTEPAFVASDNPHLPGRLHTDVWP